MTLIIINYILLSGFPYLYVITYYILSYDQVTLARPRSRPRLVPPPFGDARAWPWHALHGWNSGGNYGFCSVALQKMSKDVLNIQMMFDDLWNWDMKVEVRQWYPTWKIYDLNSFDGWRSTHSLCVAKAPEQLRLHALALVFDFQPTQMFGSKSGYGLRRHKKTLTN